MNKIYRIGHEEPGIAEFQISKFGNSEIDSPPLTKWAALGSFSALRFDSFEKWIFSKNNSPLLDFALRRT
jgi:hypothetical protein